MLFDDSLSDGESQPGSAGFAEGDEGFEELLNYLLSNPGSGVLNLGNDFPRVNLKS